MEDKVKIFMGGTCEGYKWRDELVSYIDLNKVNPFNPIVKEWNEEAKQRELYERENTDICLYVITPHMSGAYSIAEVIDDSNKRPDKTAFIVIDRIIEEEDKSVVTFTDKMKKSLEAVKEMVKRNNGMVFENLVEFAHYVNNLR